VTNLPFLRALLKDPAVRAATPDTEWIEREFLERFQAMVSAPAPELVLIAAEAAESLHRTAQRPGAAASERGAVPDVFSSLGPWRLPGLSA
jgi:acetyl/propionyl-CoA carboxylase alpha subunit